MEDRKELFLKIARMLARKVHISEICSELNVSGKTVGAVKRLIDNGYISLDEKGRPAFTTSFDEAEEFLEEYQIKRKAIRDRALGRKRGRPSTKPATASEAVEAVLKGEVTREAEGRTRQYFAIGKAVASAYWKWAQKHGIPIEEAVKQDVGKIVTKALEKEVEYDKLVKYAVALEEELRIARKEADPIARLRRAAALINRFTELALATEIAEEVLGTPILNLDPIARHYNRIINLYLTREA